MNFAEQMVNKQRPEPVKVRSIVEVTNPVNITAILSH